MSVEIRRLLGLWEETLGGAPYHGPSVLRILETVDAGMAARKDASTHSIWELVLHMTAELDYARTLIEGTAVPWIEGETTWKTPADGSEPAWRDTVEALVNAHRALTRAAGGLDERSLEEKVRPVSGTFYRMLHGVMHHNIYHAGQISLMVRQIASGSR